MACDIQQTKTIGLLKDDALAKIVEEFFPSKNARIISANFEPCSSKKKQYTGVHELLIVEACEKDAEEATKKTLRFYTKSLLPTNDAKLFVQECKYYGEIAPRLLEDFKSEIWAPKCYSATDGLLVIEDLSLQGYETRHNKSLTPDDLTSAIHCLARMHAASFLLEAKLKKPLIEAFPDFVGEEVFPEGDIFWKWYLPSIESGEAVATHLGLDPKHISAAFKLMEEKVKYTKSKKNVFCHFDLWRNNIMLTKSEDDAEVSCRFIDFQKVVYSSYIINLQALVYLNATSSPRNFEPYVKLYHDALKHELLKHGYEENDVISYEETLRDLEDKRVYGHVAAVVYLPMVLLNSRTGQDFVADRQKYDYYLYKSRKELVFRVMKMDENYRVRVEEAVRDMCEFMENLEKKSD